MAQCCSMLSQCCSRTSARRSSEAIAVGGGGGTRRKAMYHAQRRTLPEVPRTAAVSWAVCARGALRCAGGEEWQRGCNTSLRDSWLLPGASELDFHSMETVLRSNAYHSTAIGHVPNSMRKD